MAPKSEAPSPRPGGRSFGLLLGRSLFFVVMTTCALVSTVAQVRILDVNGQLLASKQSHQISVRPNRTLTDQPLTGTTSAIFNSSLGFALFTDLAFMQPASSVKLIFQCESCVNSGGTKLTIVSGSHRSKSPPPSIILHTCFPDRARTLIHIQMLQDRSVASSSCPFTFLSLYSHQVLTSQPGAKTFLSG